MAMSHENELVEDATWTDENLSSEAAASIGESSSSSEQSGVADSESELEEDHDSANDRHDFGSPQIHILNEARELEGIMKAAIHGHPLPPPTGAAGGNRQLVQVARSRTGSGKR